MPFIRSYGCCSTEIENAISSTYDWSRLGVVEAALAPSESDLLIVAGWITPEVAEELKQAHNQLMGKKSVIAIGACAISGGPYLASKEKPILVHNILPVDIYVPGCPPRPEAILEAIKLLKQKLKPGPDQLSVLYRALRDQAR